MTGQLTAQINTSDSSNSQSRGFGFPASAETAVDGSELFTGRPQVKFVCPRTAGLAVQMIIGLCDRSRFEQVAGRIAFLRDHAIKDDMCDMNVLRAEFAGHRLRQSA